MAWWTQMVCLCA